MAYIDDDELKRLREERPITGNDTIDGYNLGFDAGFKAGAEKEKAQTDLYRGWWNESKKELDESKARISKLEEKVKKLKRKLKGVF